MTRIEIVRPTTRAELCLHTSAYVSIRQLPSFDDTDRDRTSNDQSSTVLAYVSVSQHPLAFVSICPPQTRAQLCLHTSAYVSIRQHPSANVRHKPELNCACIRQRMSASVSIRQHMSATNQSSAGDIQVEND
jgi:hypothetical protein